MSKPPRFTWKTADGAEHEQEVTAAEISIGRAPTCDIVLADDQMVSRRHAVVRRQGNVCTLVDLGSSNGTLINGVEIHDATILKQHDRVTIGDHDLLFAEAQETAQPFAPAYPSFMPTPSVAEIPTLATPNTPQYPPASSPFYQPASPGPVPPSIWAPPPIEPLVPVAAAPTPPASTFDILSERDTGSLGYSEQISSSYVHTQNGKEVERDETTGRFQDNVNFSTGYSGATIDWQPRSSAPLTPPSTSASGPFGGSSSFTPAPSAGQRQDTPALVASLKEMIERLQNQVGDGQVAGDLRNKLQAILNQLDGVLQRPIQPESLGELQRLADNVAQTPHVDQVAEMARRARDIRDALNAEQQMLTALAEIRRQLDQALNS